MANVVNKLSKRQADKSRGSPVQRIIKQRQLWYREGGSTNLKYIIPQKCIMPVRVVNGLVGGIACKDSKVIDKRYYSESPEPAS